MGCDHFCVCVSAFLTTFRSFCMPFLCGFPVLKRNVQRILGKLTVFLHCFDGAFLCDRALFGFIRLQVRTSDLALQLIEHIEFGAAVLSCHHTIDHLLFVFDLGSVLCFFRDTGLPTTT